jgi:hypothetical protein
MQQLISRQESQAGRQRQQFEEGGHGHLCTVLLAPGFHQACKEPAPPGFARSCATLASTLLPSVTEKSMRASEGREGLLPLVVVPAVEIVAPPDVEPLPGGGTCKVWCLPTRRSNCRPGSGRRARAAPRRAPAGVCLKRTSTRPGAAWGAPSFQRRTGAPSDVSGGGAVAAAAASAAQPAGYHGEGTWFSSRLLG